MTSSEFELHWIKFAKSLRNVGVMLIFAITPFLAYVMIPIQFIFAMIAVNALKNLNRDINNPYLKSFESKYIAASVFKLIGGLVVHAGATLMYLNNIGYI